MCDKLNYEQPSDDWTLIDTEGHTDPRIRALLDENPAMRYDTTPIEVLARLNLGLVPLGTATAVLGAFVEKGYTLFPDDEGEEQEATLVIDLPLTVGELALAEETPDLPPQVA